VGVIGSATSESTTSRSIRPCSSGSHGIVDSDPARVDLIAERYGAKVFRNYHELLSQVDAVSLAVPTEKHYDVAKDVLSAGVHLLVESRSPTSSNRRTP